MRKTVVYSADDKKVGMSVEEVAEVMALACPATIPIVTIKIGGKIQTIKIEEEQGCAES